jgi:hypothetical protein
MTAQIGERLLLDGKEHVMCTEPLAVYFPLAGIESNFQVNCSALWRGYVGLWEIIDSRLYLVELNGTLLDGKTPASLESLFPGFPDRVFAHWYTGQLRVPTGKLLQYVHGGYASTYESDVLIEVSKGVVVTASTQVNGVADDPTGTDGYRIHAMTTFARDTGSAEESL